MGKSVSTKRVSQAEMLAKIAELSQRVTALETKVTTLEAEKMRDIVIVSEDDFSGETEPQTPFPADLGSEEILYALPDAPRAHLLLFQGNRAIIVTDEAAAKDWLNNPHNERPLEIWEMKQRTVR